MKRRLRVLGLLALISLTLVLGQGGADLYLMFNAGTEAETFVLPVSPHGGNWRLAVDTFRPSPQDLFEAGEEIVLDNQQVYRVEARSSVILIARPQGLVRAGGPNERG